MLKRRKKPKINPIGEQMVSNSRFMLNVFFHSKKIHSLFCRKHLFIRKFVKAKFLSSVTEGLLVLGKTFLCNFQILSRKLDTWNPFELQVKCKAHKVMHVHMDSGPKNPFLGSKHVIQGALLLIISSGFLLSDSLFFSKR